MRALLFVLGLLFATPALAAPICFTRAGDAVHCDAKDAMPLGWRLPPDEAARRQMNQPQATFRRDPEMRWRALCCFSP